MKLIQIVIITSVLATSCGSECDKTNDGGPPPTCSSNRICPTGSFESKSQDGGPDENCEASTPSLMITTVECCLQNGDGPIHVCAAIIPGGDPRILSNTCPGCDGGFVCDYSTDPNVVADCNTFGVQ